MNLTNNLETTVTWDKTRLSSCIQTCQDLLFKELQTTSIESVNLLNPIISRFYNLNQLHKFTFLINEPAQLALNEINQDHTFLVNYELMCFSHTKSFTLFDDFFTVKVIIANQLMQMKPKLTNVIRNYLTFIYDKSIDHCILHKRYQVNISHIRGTVITRK